MDGNKYTVVVDIPDDPIAADEGISIEIHSSTLPASRRRLYVDATKTRAQLITTAMQALSAFLQNQPQ